MLGPLKLRRGQRAGGRRNAILALGALAAVVAVLAMVAPDAVRRLTRGDSCPGATDRYAAPPDADLTPEVFSSSAPNPPEPDGRIASVAVRDGVRVPALWPFASDSPWNTPLGAEATYSAEEDPRVAGLRAGRGYINIDEYSIQIHTSRASDPLEAVRGIEAGTVFEMRIPETARPSRGTDRNLDVVQPDGVTLWENWLVSGGPGDWAAAHVVEVPLDGTGISSGIRAYGGSTAAGLVREFELEEGHIRHAIAMALCRTQLRNGPVWPAWVEDGGGTDTGDYNGLIAMGSLLAIPPDVDIDSLGLTPGGRAIALAYQHYGGYVTDSAGSTVIAFVEPSTPKHLRPTERDAEQILRQLRIIDNNDESSPGGPGARRAPVAPPLAP